MLRVAGVTLMVARRCCTVTNEESLVPPASVATTYVEPFATANTEPIAFTFTLKVSRLVQVNVPATFAPTLSFACAARRNVSESAVSVSKRGLTTVDAATAPAVTVTGVEAGA